MKNFLLAAVFLAMSVSVALGQMDKEAHKRAVEEQRIAMKKLELWAGKWEGSGWMQQGSVKETFTGTENVQRKIDGLAMLVEGKFTNKENVVIHETLAVVSYNPKTKNYDFNTYRHENHSSSLCPDMCCLFHCGSNHDQKSESKQWSGARVEGTGNPLARSSDAA